MSRNSRSSSWANWRRETGEFGAGHDVVDPDHDRTGQPRHGAAQR